MIGCLLVSVCLFVFLLTQSSVVCVSVVVVVMAYLLLVGFGIVCLGTTVRFGVTHDDGAAFNK